MMTDHLERATAFESRVRASTSVLGLPISARSQVELVDLVCAGASEARSMLMVGVNAWVCELARAQRRFRQQLLEADLLYADGQSVAWAGRLLGGTRIMRTATTDFAVPLIARLTALDLGVYFLGARPGIADRAAGAVRLVVPRARIAVSDGYFATASVEEVLDRIAAHGTRVLFVGMGDPGQVEFATRYRARLAGIVVITCGGLFDWLSGSHRRAPGWMIGLGLEWLWRLLIEPRRLWRRYLVGNPRFVLRVLMDRARIAPGG